MHGATNGDQGPRTLLTSEGTTLHMSRTKKIIAGIVVAIVVLLLVAYMAVDAIAASVLRSEGTSILGVKTDVSSIRLGLFSPETSVNGLVIANPPGFDKPEFLHLDRGVIAASVGTMLSSSITIPTVKLDGLTLDLEQIDGQLNATVIIDHVTKATAGDAGDAGEPVHLTIGELEITNIKLTARGSIVNLAGGKLDATIPSFVMKDVGTKTEGGDIAGQLISLTLSILMQHIMDNPVEGLSGAAVGSVAMAIESVPGLRRLGMGKALVNVNQTLNKGLGKATQGVKDLGEGIGGKISDELTGLIGGGPKKKDADKGQDKDKDKGKEGGS